MKTISISEAKKDMKKIDEITNINANSKSFDFLKYEPDLYSVSDLKKLFLL
jgi:hypothetical protein